jgi:hypothetical protein
MNAQPVDILGDLLGGADPTALATQQETQAIRAGLRYDYSEIDPDQRDAAQNAAVQIKRSERKATENLVEVGQQLQAVKKFLPHGQFMDWCRVEFGMSPSTVENMINVATVFGAKSQTFGILSDSAMYLLAAPSTPEPARIEVIAQAQAGGHSPTVRQVKAVIAKHRTPPQPVPSPEQRQYASAVATLPPAAKRRLEAAGVPHPAALDDLEVLDSVTVRVRSDGTLNMDWEPEEWEADQRRIKAAAAAAPTNSLPADLAARGWELRQVAGVGKWYCNNSSGPRATGLHSSVEDAIAQAYTMQRDLAWEAQPEPEPEDYNEAINHLHRAADELDRAAIILMSRNHERALPALGKMLAELTELIEELQP